MEKELLRVVSLFSGAGGLDLGFRNAGFDIIWANENDKTIADTFRHNHKGTTLNTKSITSICPEEIPSCDGVIGGPPCQSWSEAGALRGLDDKRGQLFFDFIKVIKEKQPKFFLAENVSGMLSNRNSEALECIKVLLRGCGYRLSFKLLDAKDYGVPQSRKRVFFVGVREDLGTTFVFPAPTHKERSLTLQDAISDLEGSACPAPSSTPSIRAQPSTLNHEYLVSGWSPIFMSRNRVRSWAEPSFTIQAGGRQVPLHPQAPPMPRVGKDAHVFQKGAEHLYRRLSVRECARIQTFPDDFEFKYTNVLAGYKMVGNAVPPRLAELLAEEIRLQLPK